jgi:hypothetical protein
MGASDFIVGFVMVSGLILLGFVISLLIMFPLMWLWNWLMPTLFHLPTITIWQAWGLSVLSGLLFKSSVTTKS